MKKILTLVISAFILSACIIKKDTVDLTNQPQSVESGMEENYETVRNEEEAAVMNQQIQEKIEQVEVSDRVFFALNSNNLTSEAKKILDIQAEWLISESDINIVIEGHCDERGTREYNIALGAKRANSVKDYLISSGIDSYRIKTVSYGKERPALVGYGEKIWSKNRRSITIKAE
jgi:peptidoglycan-associated lipoprotein